MTSENQLKLQGDLFYETEAYLTALLKSNNLTHDHAGYIKAILQEESANLISNYPNIEGDHYFQLIHSVFIILSKGEYISQLYSHGDQMRITIKLEGIRYLIQHQLLSDYLKLFYGETEKERDKRIDRVIKSHLKKTTITFRNQGSIWDHFKKCRVDVFKFIYALTQAHYFLSDEDMEYVFSYCQLHWLENLDFFKAAKSKLFVIPLKNRQLTYPALTYPMTPLC